MADESVVLYDVREGVATITLNRPASRNALNDALLAGLSEALAQAKEPRVRAIVLAGAGKGFCSGADLAVLGALPVPQDVTAYLTQVYAPLIERIVTLPKPVIAAVNGVAAGAGASLALACDLRVMADDSSLLFAFSNIGLVPDAGASWFLARQVGYSRAYELAIEGERIDAARCLALGLANRVVPAAKLSDEAHIWALRLAARPTQALGLTKRILHAALTNDLTSSMALEAQFQGIAISSVDHREGVAALREKRLPHFRGE